MFPVFPMLPFPLTSEDWDWRLLRDTLTAYMNILGWKVGGNSYTDKTNIPPGWPNSMDYNDFKGPSGAKTSEAKIIIRSLLVHHGYDPDVHHVPVTENNNNNNNKKRRARKNRSKTSAAIIEDEERRIEDETGDAEDRRENMMEDRSENVMEDRREDTANGENTAPRVVTVGILTDMNEGEEYTDMAAVDLDSVPVLQEDGEGQHYVYVDVVQLPQDGGGEDVSAPLPSIGLGGTKYDIMNDMTEMPPPEISREQIRVKREPEKSPEVSHEQVRMKRELEKELERSNCFGFDDSDDDV